MNHGIPLELLERVKKVCSECYRLREAGFKASEPVRTLEASMWQLVRCKNSGSAEARTAQDHVNLPENYVLVLIVLLS